MAKLPKYFCWKVIPRNKWTAFDLEAVKPEEIAEAERGQSMWTVFVDKRSQTWEYRCAYCHTTPPKNCYNQEWLSKYCPECGCKMEVEERDEETN